MAQATAKLLLFYTLLLVLFNRLIALGNLNNEVGLFYRNNNMQKFEWNDNLSVGVPMIDTQHKELISAFNDLSEAIEQGTGATAIKKLLTFLKYFTEWHFEQEENCAAKHKCAIAETNHQAHTKFLNIFSTLQTEYRESGASETIARKAHAQLADWLVSHIMTIDTQIGACIRHATAVHP